MQLLQFNNMSRANIFRTFIYFLDFHLAANRPGFTYEHLLPGDTSSHVIDSLEEDKEYTINIYAVYPQGPSEPLSIVGKTCKFIGQNIRILLTYLNRNPEESSSTYKHFRKKDIE